jgi:hypothetical protein
VIAEPTKTLPHRTSYGPFERIVEPGRHVYRATMDYRRWMIGGFCVAFAAALAWLASHFYADKSLSGTPWLLFWLMPALGSSLFALLSIPVFVSIFRLTITPQNITIFSFQPLIWRFGTWTWQLQDIVSVSIGSFPVFQRASRSEMYRALLEFKGGVTFRPYISFDDRRSVARFTGDLTESIRLMASNEAS